MLSEPSRELLQRLARLAASEDGQALLGWLEESRQETHRLIERDDSDLPLERGSARTLGRLAERIRGAAEWLARNR
jgi:hypothetical protein